MSKKITDGYKEQDGCHNCHSVVKIIEHDDPTQYLCGYKAPERPRSGSTYMGESFVEKFGEPVKWIKAKMKAWEEWMQGRRVKPYGTCDYFEKGLEGSDNGG